MNLRSLRSRRLVYPPAMPREVAGEVRRLLAEDSAALQLEPLSDWGGFDHLLTRPRIQKPGLALSASSSTSMATGVQIRGPSRSRRCWSWARRRCFGSGSDAWGSRTEAPRCYATGMDRIGTCSALLLALSGCGAGPVTGDEAIRG